MKYSTPWIFAIFIIYILYEAVIGFQKGIGYIIKKFFLFLSAIIIYISSRPILQILQSSFDHIVPYQNSPIVSKVVELIIFTIIFLTAHFYMEHIIDEIWSQKTDHTHYYLSSYQKISGLVVGILAACIKVRFILGIIN